MAICLEPGHYYGIVTKKRSVGNVLLTESAYEARVALPKHAHRQASFCYVLGGSFMERSDGVEVLCDMGTVLFRPGGQVHSDRFLGESTRCLGVEFEPADELEPMASRHPRVGRIAACIFAEMKLNDSCSQMAVEGWLLLLKAEMLRSNCIREAQMPTWLQRVIERIRSEFREPLSLLELSRTANVHPVHLCREFGRAVGCSPGHYMRKLRIEWACRELAERSRPIGEIAVEAGFADQSHFTRTLRALTGSTPNEIREGSKGRG